MWLVCGCMWFLSVCWGSSIFGLKVINLGKLIVRKTQNYLYLCLECKNYEGILPCLGFFFLLAFEINIIRAFSLPFIPLSLPRHLPALFQIHGHIFINYCYRHTYAYVYNYNLLILYNVTQMNYFRAGHLILDEQWVFSGDDYFSISALLICL